MAASRCSSTALRVLRNRGRDVVDLGERDQRVAGSDVARAVIAEEARRMLVSVDETVTHKEVMLDAPSSTSLES